MPISQLETCRRPETAGEDNDVMSLRRKYGPEIRFPPDPESLMTINVGPPINGPVEVITPHALEEKYGIGIYTRILNKTGTVYANSDAYQILVRPQEAAFMQIFGFLNQYDDPHLIRRLNINFFLTTNLCEQTANAAVAPLEEKQRWVSERLSFIKTMLADNPDLRMPHIYLPRAAGLGYDFSGPDLSRGENITRLDGYIARFEGLRDLYRSFCADKLLLGGAEGIVPEFIFDEKGQPVIAPDGIAMMNLRSKIFIALRGVDPITDIGPIVAHEAEHVRNDFNPNPRNEEEQIPGYDEQQAQAAADSYRRQVLNLFVIKRPDEQPAILTHLITNPAGTMFAFIGGVTAGRLANHLNGPSSELPRSLEKRQLLSDTASTISTALLGTIIR